MTPISVNLFAAGHWSHPLNKTNIMIIVTEYELVEKIAGVFRSVCRSSSLPLLWGTSASHRQQTA